MVSGELPKSFYGDEWFNKTARFAFVLSQVQSAEIRLGVLKRLCEKVDEPGFPGLLKLMMTIAESDHQTAKQALAETIALALQRLDLPHGELTAWGTGTDWNDIATKPADWLHIQRLSRAPIRKFGPIEYLAVWYCQKTQRPYLSQEAYIKAIQQLVHLVNCNELASRLYPAKILSDLDHGQEGNFSRRSRECLGRLAHNWLEGKPPQQVALSSL